MMVTMSYLELKKNEVERERDREVADMHWNFGVLATGCELVGPPLRPMTCGSAIVRYINKTLSAKTQSTL